MQGRHPRNLASHLELQQSRRFLHPAAYLGIGFLLTLFAVFTPSPSYAWSIAWCAGGQDGHPTAAGNAWCAAHFPVPGVVVAAPTPDPQASTSQNQNQTQSQTTNASINNNVAGNYGFVPVYVPGPMAGCGDSPSLNAAVGVSRLSGFLPYSSESVQIGATIPIGPHSKYCATPAPPPAPVTNIYYAAPAAPQIIIERPPPAVSPVRQVTIIYRDRTPKCASYPAHDIAAARAKAREARHHRTTPAQDAAFALLVHACQSAAFPVDP